MIDREREWYETEIQKLKDQVGGARRDKDNVLEDNQRLREEIKDLREWQKAFKETHYGKLLDDFNKQSLEIQRLREELEDEQKLGDRFANLNRRTAKALGKPTTGEGSTWHDLPECVKERGEEIERLREQYQIQAEMIHMHQRVIESHETAMREALDEVQAIEQLGSAANAARILRARLEPPKRCSPASDGYGHALDCSCAEWRKK